MTKEEFINYAEKELGYANYKDLVAELGYGRRNLDRYRYEDKLNEKILERLNEKIPKGTKEEKKVEKKIEEKIVTKKEVVKEKEAPLQKSKVGLIIPNKEYHQSKKLGSSKIKMILENAREYQAKYVTKEIQQKNTDALVVGSLHHTLVLEPETLKDEYLLLEIPTRPVKSDYVEAVKKLNGKIGTKTTTKGEVVVSDTVDELKEQYQKLISKSKKTIATQAQLEIAKVTSRKALDSWFVVEAGGRQLLKAQLKDVLDLDNCYVERTFYGVIDGIEVQVRPDILVNLSKNNEFWFVIDLKTAQDATMGMFAQQSSKFYYDIQEYVYREVLRQNGIIVKDFRFCVSGKSELSKSAYYQLHNEDIEDAEKIVSQILKKYKYCKENNIWEEGKFDYHKMRFEPTAIIKLPAYRKFQMIDLGVM